VQTQKKRAKKVTREFKPASPARVVARETDREGRGIGEITEQQKKVGNKVFCSDGDMTLTSLDSHLRWSKGRPGVSVSTAVGQVSG
jgi:hypothetical protein